LPIKSSYFQEKLYVLTAASWPNPFKRFKPMYEGSDTAVHMMFGFRWEWLVYPLCPKGTARRGCKRCLRRIWWFISWCCHKFDS